jgi:hypothetical protein
MNTIRPPTSAEIQEWQRQQADTARAAKAKLMAVANSPAAPPTTTAIAVAARSSTAVALPGNRTAVQQYLDEIASVSIVGRSIKFDGKLGKFITPDDGEDVEEGAEFIALCDETQIGWIKFIKGEAPAKVVGLLYDGFVPPPRSALDETDEEQWPDGLSGKPEDPWKHMINLVLQRTGTNELFTFGTLNATGRRAVGNLLRHYDRMQRTNPNELPVVRLKVGGFQHRDDRIGFVPTPVLAVVGRAPRDSAATPDTSPSGDMNDQIPF